MYPQDPQNESVGTPPESRQNLEPTPSVPPEPVTAAISQPADAWPPHTEATGDVEPSTQSPVQPQPFVVPAPAQPTTDELIAEHNQSVQATPPSSSTRTGRRKPLIVALIIAAVLIVLGGAGAAAYMWYENPDKVVADSIGNLLTARTFTYMGTIDAKADTVKLSVALDGGADTNLVSGHAKAKISLGALSFDAEVSLVGVNSDGTIYVKLMNAKDIAAALFQSLPTTTKSSVDQLVAKIDNKWIKLTPKDYGSSTSSDTTACSNKVFDRLQNDANYRKELTQLYEKQRFVTVAQQLGEKNGSLGYKLTIDVNKEKAFADGFKQTTVFADLKKCDSSLADADFMIKSADKVPQIELWADRWTHDPTSITLSNPAGDTTNTYNVTLQPSLGKKANVEVPKDATTLDELKADLSSMMGGGPALTGASLSDSAL